MLILMSAVTPVTAGDDMLRFTNGDQLRGHFEGLKEGPLIQWRHEDLAGPAEFKTSRVHQIVLQGGRPQSPLQTLSYLEIVNRDRLPGRLVAMDDDAITIDTDYAGILRVPREHVAIFAPNPMGGRVHYHGPFAESDWNMIHLSHLDGLPAGDAANDAPDQEDEENGESEESGEEDPGRWVFTGSSWYWNHKRAGTALVREDGMPMHSVVRFDLAWKGRLSLAIVIHADFARPGLDENVRRNQRRAFNAMDPNSLGRLFGNSEVLQLYSNYFSHLRTVVDEDGKVSFERGARNNHNVRLGDSGRARIELRSNRQTGEVMFFIDDEFAAQWGGGDLLDDHGRPSPGGSGLGFIVQSDDSPVRISDIVICEWNGMPDSARSMQVNDRDIVLMTNGTDRYAGNVVRLDDQGKIHFSGRHGSFQLPLEDIAEIRFARQSLRQPETSTGPGVMVRMGPIGAVSGTPVGGDRGRIRLDNPSVGGIDLSLDAATLIDFNPSDIIIDDWTTEF